MKYGWEIIDKIHTQKNWHLKSIVTEHEHSVFGENERTCSQVS